MATLRLRSQPLLDSFCGTMDLKLGATLITLFAGLNKVAGAYGLLAVLLSGGAALSEPVAQLTMYAYSIASLAALIWGLKKISEENGPQLLFYSHLFAADHLLSTLYTAFFAVVWYAWVPHDGRRVANSDAQKAMMGGSQTVGGMGDEERVRAAGEVWLGERGFSAAVLVVGWLLKVYFIFVLYSFAFHLRRGTYHSLPQSRSNSKSRQTGRTRASSTGGPQYLHLRQHSLASTAGMGGRGSMDGLDGTETTMAETLWEDQESEEAAVLPPLGERRTSRGVLPPPVTTRVWSGSGTGSALPPPGLTRNRSGSGSALLAAAAAANAPASGPPASPAFAKGTGIARTVSGGVLVSGGGVKGQAEEAARKEQAEGSNPFTSLLGRMSEEVPR
ncbi:hypothetical protein JCM11641_006124 [Rhodosporidiobolus odoratus]